MPVESLERKRRRVISNIEISGCSAERDIGVYVDESFCSDAEPSSINKSEVSMEIGLFIFMKTSLVITVHRAG